MSYYTTTTYESDVPCEKHFAGDDLDRLLDTVSRVTGITKDEMKGKCRKREIVIARQLYCKTGRDLYSTCYSDRLIAVRVFKDRTTLLHSTKVIENALSNNDPVSRNITELYNEIIRIL